LVLDSEPTFIVKPPLFTPVVLGAILLAIGSLALATSLVYSVLTLGLGALLLFWYFSSSSTYEFYEKYLVRKSLGRVRQRVNYAEVVSLRYDPPDKPTHRPRIVLTAEENGGKSTLIVVGDPDDEELGLSLSEWLHGRIKAEATQ